MKNNEFGINSFDPATVGSEKLDKDKKSSKEKSSKKTRAEKQQKAEEHIASSIDKLELFGEHKDGDKSKSEKAADKPQDPEKITDEETKHIEQQIARDHLAEIAKSNSATTETLEPATEFLQKVSDGTDVETAFAEVAAEQDLTQEEIAEVLHDIDVMPEAEQSSEEASEIIEVSAEDAASDIPEDGINLRHSPVSVPSAGVAPAVAAVVAVNTLPAAANTYYQAHQAGGNLLIGGAVGYLLGRRHGRNKSEKQVAPLQHKLEKQIITLEQQITQKEQALVAMRTVKPGAEQAKPAARGQEAPVRRAEQVPAPRAETRLGMEKPRAEQLGRMVITAEAPTKTVEKIKQPGNIREAFRAEEVKTMDRTEMLLISEKIIVEGASLRRIYESGLIGEGQLRHLVAEHLAGKDIREDLRRDMVEHEIDFERDPQMRDRVRSHLSGKKGEGGMSALLESVGITNDTVDPTLQRRIESDNKRYEQQQQSKQRQRIAADTAMATAIIVLAVTVIILVTRG